MPNSTGKKPLRLLCPSCGKIGHHEIVKTHPKNYFWSNETTPLFERISGRDLLFRERDRECEYCYNIFAAVEMPKLYLKTLIEEVQKLENLANQLQIENARIKTELEIETDETEERGSKIAQLEGENAKLNTELSHLREGVKEVAIRAKLMVLPD